MSSTLVYKRITLYGSDTAYVDTDPEAHTAVSVVICLHGLPASSYVYRNVIDNLSVTARVLAPDLPGFGNSYCCRRST
ncbi:MAG: hypothetical protein CSA49_06950 [Gammaproteobacteria bacterium]|nr:MAG: hypothetical protein CSA49_06950 [Gammaproteobacteria bacterium]